MSPFSFLSFVINLYPKCTAVLLKSQAIFKDSCKSLHTNDLGRPGAPKSLTVNELRQVASRIIRRPMTHSGAIAMGESAIIRSIIFLLLFSFVSCCSWLDSPIGNDSTRCDLLDWGVPIACGCLEPVKTSWAICFNLIQSDCGVSGKGFTLTCEGVDPSDLYISLIEFYCSLF